jgi:hypothetical protein
MLDPYSAYDAVRPAPSGTITGTKFLTNHIFGRGRGFGSTLGAGATDVIDTNRVLQYTQVTMAAWVYVRALPAIASIILWQEYATGSGRGESFGVFSTGKVDYLRARNSNVNPGEWETTNAVIAAGGTYLIGLSIDNSSVSNDPSIYVNGVSVGVTETATPFGSLDTLTKTHRIGNVQSGTSLPFDGVIGQVMVWDRVLAAEEHWMLYAPLTRQALIADQPARLFAYSAVPDVCVGPSSDQAAGNWTPSAGGVLYDMVDETSASDSDYIRSGAAPNDDRCVMKLPGIAKPHAGTVRFSVRHRDTP